MTTINRQEIDLIIRAQLKGQNTFSGVAKSIGQLNKQIDGQVAAAKRGEESIDELKASLLQLQQAQDALKDQANLISQYEKTAQAVGKVEERLTKAKAAYDKYRENIKDISAATDTQSKRLDSLAASVVRAEAAVVKQTAQQHQYRKAIEQTGIAIKDRASAETSLRRSAADVGIAIDKVQGSIRDYSANLKVAREEERKLLAGQTLRKMAEDAIAATKGYKTLGNTIKALPAQGNMRAAIQDIIEPSNRARKSLADLAIETDKIEQDLKGGKIAADKLAETLRSLRAVQGRLLGQSGQVEDYSRQAAKLRELRAEFSASRRQVLELAEATRLSKDRNAELEQKLKTAQAAHVSVRAAMVAQVATLRSLRMELEASGIKTNDLAGAQQRLTAVATKTVSVLNQVRAAAQIRVAPGAQNGLDFGGFNEGARTTLSLTQRLKGEFLALGASYLGLYGIINNGTKVIEAFNTRQQIQQQLSIAVGSDQRAIAEEYRYAQEQAERLGVEFTVLAKGYAKFLAGGITSGRTREELRFIFESFSEVGRVANLTEDDLNGIFKALEQIVSKGKIQSEELRGQLGDRLFGAFGVAQEALKEKFGANLDKALKDGKVLASDLIEIAEAYREIVAKQLPGATDALAAEQNRFNTELFNFKTLIADSGFAESYRELLVELTAFFKSTDGKEFAKTIAEAFTALLKILKFVLDNLETFLTIGKALIAIGLAKAIVGMAFAAIQAADKFKAASLSIDLMRSSASALQRTIGFMLNVLRLFNIAIAAITIGSVLYDQVPQVKTFVDETVKAFDKVVEKFKEAYREGGLLKGLWEAIKETGEQAISSVEKRSRERTQELSKNAIKEDNAKRIRQVEAQLAEGKKTIGVGNFTTKIGLTEADKTRLKAELRALNEFKARLEKAEQPKDKAKADAPKVETTPKPKVEPTINAEDDEKKAKAAEKAAEKRRRIEQALQDELTRMEEKVTKKTAENLVEREAAIENSYGVLLRKIQAFYGKGSEAEKRLEAAKNALIIEEREKAAKEQIAQAERLDTALENVEAAAGKKEKLSLASRLAAIRKGYEDTYRDIEELRKRLEKDGQSTSQAAVAKVRLDSAVKTLEAKEAEQFYIDEITRREQELNRVLAERAAKLDTIETLKDTGLLTDMQARERAAEVVTELQVKIEELTAQGLEWAAANKLALDPQRAAEFIAVLTKARTSAQGLATQFFNARNLAESFSDKASNGLSTAVDAIGAAAAGTKSWGEALGDVRTAFLRFAGDFLREIGMMIAKQAILNAMQSSSAGSGGGVFGILATGLNALLGGGAGAGATMSSAGSILGTGAQSFVVHSGGVVGSTLPRRREVDSAAFIGAPRMHTGGVPGLANDEYATILQKNEEVLSADNPRNILNGGGKQETAATPPQPINVFNTIDQDSFANALFSGDRAKKGLVNVIRADVNTFKSVLGIN